MKFVLPLGAFALGSVLILGLAPAYLGVDYDTTRTLVGVAIITFGLWLIAYSHTCRNVVVGMQAVAFGSVSLLPNPLPYFVAEDQAEGLFASLALFFAFVLTSAPAGRKIADVRCTERPYWPTCSTALALASATMFTHVAPYVRQPVEAAYAYALLASIAFGLALFLARRV